MRVVFLKTRPAHAAKNAKKGVVWLNPKRTVTTQKIVIHFILIKVPNFGAR
jgi:hypothetical protein